MSTSHTFLFEDKDTIPTSVAAQMLGVKEHTVLRYEKKGELKAIASTDWRRDGSKRFRLEDVTLLAEKLKKPGLLTKEVAEILGIAPSTVVKLINNDKLKAIRTVYRGRDTFFVNEIDLQTFKEQNEIKARIKENISTVVDGHTVYLFQPFVHKETKEKARIIDISATSGRFMIETEQTLPLATLFSSGYEPTLLIGKHKYNTRKGSATFKFARPYMLNSTAYVLIEWLYHFCGPTNIKINVAGDSIHLEVKPCHLPLDPMKHKEELEYISRYVESGSLDIRHNGIFIESDIEAITFHVEKEMKQKVKEYANENNMTQEEVMLEALKAYFPS